ncbi:LpxD N-terminal domain-containing protein [Caballeronia mineralivorans]|uniref:LpxD N-terminal domain-containing protein n=1 Tax=Caballeronia mineralivorans TaxID=2010198 RepID=UPI000B26ACFF|nr:LpxD N-terminal domain-containing protein [Caballeronia mineralivorans]
MNNKFIVDARFYARSGPYNLAEVAVAANGTAEASDRMLTGVAPLQHAGPAEVSFLDNSRYASLLEKTGAGAVIVHPDMVGRVPPSASPIITTATYEGWARVSALFHPVAPTSPGIHPTAFVAPGVVVDPTAEIGAFACIEGGVQIGPRCRIGSYVSIGSGVVIGEDCRSAPTSPSATRRSERVSVCFLESVSDRRASDSQERRLVS